MDLDVAVEWRIGILESQIALPAAKEREEDLPEILTHLRKRREEEFARRAVDLTDGLMQRLLG